MKLFSISCLTITIILGCSTTNKSSLSQKELQPPEVADWPINDQFTADKDFSSLDLFLNRVAKENPSTNTTWWADYRRAQLWIKKDKNVACENFSRLAGEARFPIRRLAYLHAHKVCPSDNQILSRLEPFQIEQFDPWLSEAALDVGLQKAKSQKDNKNLVELNLKKSKMNLRKEEKVEYADEALKYARKLMDQKKIRELESRIYNLSPSRKPRPSPKDYLAVAADYRYLRNFDKAIAYYERVIHSKSFNVADKLQALRGKRMCYKVQQKRGEALRATEELGHFVWNYFNKSKKSPSDAKLLTDSHLLLARTYWTENQIRNAKKTLDLIQKTVAGKTSLAELYWLRGRMEEEKQNFAGSIEWFRKALNEPGSSPSFQDKVAWYLAWNERKQKNHKETVKILKELKDRTENNYERSRIAFWLGKSLLEIDETGDAKDEFKDLIKEDPLSFYGLLAHREINEPLPTKKIHRAESKKQNGDKRLTRRLRELIDENYLDWLIATKEDGVARNYLDHVAQSLFKKDREDIESWTQLFSMYARSQNYIALFQQLHQLDTPVRRTILEENPDMIFPNPYFETVSQAASRFGVSVEFIYSIMRQESSFNPQARSQMDAFGLMQLLPEVARRSAEANSIEYSNPDDLYEPHINIPLGSAHLRELWDKYNGEIILAVASYNASEKAILTWLQTRYRGDTLEFIEDIPYDETRDYVKLVMRNLITYQILSAGDDTITFPEWALKISYQEPERQNQ